MLRAGQYGYWGQLHAVPALERRLKGPLSQHNIMQGDPAGSRVQNTPGAPVSGRSSTRPCCFIHDAKLSVAHNVLPTSAPVSSTASHTLLQGNRSPQERLCWTHLPLAALASHSLHVVKGTPAAADGNLTAKPASLPPTVHCNKAAVAKSQLLKHLVAGSANCRAAEVLRQSCCLPAGLLL